MCPAKSRPASTSKSASSRDAAQERIDLPEVLKEMQERETKRSRRFRQWILVHSFALSLGISVWAHGMIPLIGFALPEPGVRKEQDSGLKVVLVNARHTRAPKDAQALAQVNLDGGGDHDKKDSMPTSPLPAQDARLDGDSLVETRRRVQQLEAMQRELLAQAKAAELSAAQNRQQQDNDQPSEQPAQERGLDLNAARAIARQEAVVDRVLSDYAARPRKGVISPRTKEYKLAQYGEDWRIKVQRVGELNFPRGAQGSLYGSVQVDVELRPDGSVLRADISRPSPNPKINTAALRIVRLAAPYAPFPPDIRKEYDIVQIVRTLNFTREDIGVSSQ